MCTDIRSGTQLRRLTFAVIAGSAAIVGGCSGGDKLTGPDASYLGAYTLESVNGKAVPAVILQTPTEKEEVTSGKLSLNSDGTYRATFNIRVTIGATVDNATSSSVGVWTQANNAFSLRDTSDESTMSGAYANGRLTLLEADHEITQVFKHT